MSLSQAFRRISRKTAALLAISGVVVGGAAIGFAAGTWGPDRPTYTIDNPATHVTFNSMTDNPVDGDERNFVRAKDTAGQLSLSDTVAVKPGQEYVVRMVIHNNAAENLNLTALGTTVKAAVPTTSGKSVDVTGFVSADNAKPREVWDSVRFTSDQTFNLKYVAGSAKVYNQGYAKSGASLPDSIVTSTGAKLGYEKAGDGKIPGCYEFLSYVEFKVKPQFAQTADLDMSKTVRLKGESTWHESVKAQPGATVQYRVLFKNTGQVQLDNVTVRDKLPAGVEYVTGTTNLFLGSDPNTARKLSDNITGRGVNIGSHAPGAMALVIFDAKVVSNDALATCGTNTLKNVAYVETPYGGKNDDADVVVEKECEEPTPEPKPEPKPEPTPEPKYIDVCRLEDKEYPVRIKEEDFNPELHSKNPEDCKETPAPVPEEDVVVCNPETGEIITVKESEADKYVDKDSDECKEKVVADTPAELPQTGVSDAINGLVGSAALVMASVYYIRSRCL